MVKNNNRKFRYFIKPTIITLPISIGSFILLYFLSPQAKEDLIASILNLSTTFSLTFAAFSITALALLQLLNSKEWYKSVANSVFFKSFLSRFFFSIKLSLSLLALSIISNFLTKLNQIILIDILIILHVSIVIFIICWVWDCVNDFISLFTN